MGPPGSDASSPNAPVQAPGDPPAGELQAPPVGARRSDHQRVPCNPIGRIVTPARKPLAKYAGEPLPGSSEQGHGVPPILYVGHPWETVTGSTSLFRVRPISTAPACKAAAAFIMTARISSVASLM